MGKFLDNLKAKGTDAEKDVQFAHKAAQAALQLESRLIATREKVGSEERLLQVVKSQYPLDVDRIVALTSSVEDYKKGQEIMEALKVELF